MKSGHEMLEKFLDWAITNWPKTEQECISEFGMLFMPWYKEVLEYAVNAGKLPELPKWQEHEL